MNNVENLLDYGFYLHNYSLFFCPKVDKLYIKPNNGWYISMELQNNLDGLIKKGNLKMKETKVSRLVIVIDEETKKKLQIICIQEGITLKEKITQLILSFLGKANP